LNAQIEAALAEFSSRQAKPEAHEELRKAA
jgi:hypothetical protein